MLSANSVQGIPMMRMRMRVMMRMMMDLGNEDDDYVDDDHAMG